MKLIALAAAAAAFAVSASAANAEDLFAVAYGNTVTQTMPDGSKQIIYVNADKTWETHLADGKVMKGTYEWKDEHTACFTLVDPAPQDPSKATNCNTIEGDHKVGDTWTEQLPNNAGAMTMSITAGR